MEQSKALPSVGEDTIHRLREISAWVSSVLDLDHLLELIIETATRMMRAKATGTPFAGFGVPKAATNALPASRGSSTITWQTLRDLIKRKST